MIELTNQQKIQKLVDAHMDLLNVGITSVELDTAFSNAIDQLKAQATPAPETTKENQ